MNIPLDRNQPEKSETLTYTIFSSPFGKTGVAVTPFGICRVVLSVLRESDFVEILKILHPSPIKQPNQLKPIEKEFNLYFDKKLKIFSFKPDLRQGTLFQKKVWNKLISIPFGKTRSYKWLANAIGEPKAFRAAGNANGKNPIPLIAPCHRVIRENGHLGGFTGGSHLKQYLLNIEK